jgi:hypothetical protein
VALIRTDVSEDRIASIFRVPLHEASFSPYPAVPYGCIPHTILYSIYRYSKPTPNSSNLGLFTRSPLGVVSYESLPVQELSTSLCACSHSCTLKMEAIRSSETSVLIRATRSHLPEDDNHLCTACLKYDHILCPA